MATNIVVGGDGSKKYFNPITNKRKRIMIVYPFGYETSGSNQCIVISKGGYGWDHANDLVKWTAYAQLYADYGYVVAYPEIQRNSREDGEGINDLLSVMETMRDDSNLSLLNLLPAEGDANVDKIGLLASSYGGMIGKDFFMGTFNDIAAEHSNDKIEAFCEIAGVHRQNRYSFETEGTKFPERQYPQMHPEHITNIQAPYYGQVEWENHPGFGGAGFLIKMALYLNAMDTYIPTHDHGGSYYAGSSHGFFFDDSDSNSGTARTNQRAFWDEHLKETGGGPPTDTFPSDGGIVDEGNKSLSSSYGWVVDQIMLEEATTGQVVASAYINPFEDLETTNFMLASSINSDFVKEFVQWVAYCSGISFAPPQIGTSAPGLISGQLNSHSKKIINDMRTKFLKLYSKANEGVVDLEIPVHGEFKRE